MKDIDKLLKKVKTSSLSKEEIDYVAEQIKNIKSGKDDNELYPLILILGIARAKQYKNLIEKYLYYPEDTMVSAMALKTLCYYFDTAHEYMDDLKKFIKGVDWDEFEDVRQYAIAAAGEFLRTHPRKDLYELLLEILHNENEEVLFREFAYTALARASGQEWNELLPDEKPNPQILNKVNNILASLKDKNEERKI